MKKSKNKIKKNRKTNKPAKKAAKKPIKKSKKIAKIKVPKIRTKKKKTSAAISSGKPDKKVVVKKGERQSVGLERLLHKGKERGYVTYDEILKEFPTVEEDIVFLDELYDKLSASGVDILEGGG
ncbi:MAG TPA: RNA polymerase sigma factor region1.1 domain-containing protein, partial [Candidatus Paceibacterota bacterium]